MVDIETMGTGPTSAIIAIGAVCFNKDGSRNEPFYINVDLNSCLEEGMTVDGNTIAWWMQQDAEARGVLFDDAVSLEDALISLARYINKHLHPLRGVMWSHATFDAPILGYAYDLVSRRMPVHFRKQRDIRTLTQLYRTITSNEWTNTPREGTHHNAADDAVYQAEYVSTMLRGIDSTCQLELPF